MNPAAVTSPQPPSLRLITKDGITIFFDMFFVEKSHFMQRLMTHRNASINTLLPPIRLDVDSNPLSFVMTWSWFHKNDGGPLQAEQAAAYKAEIRKNSTTVLQEILKASDYLEIPELSTFLNAVLDDRSLYGEPRSNCFDEDPCLLVEDRVDNMQLDLPGPESLKRSREPDLGESSQPSSSKKTRFF